MCGCIALISLQCSSAVVQVATTGADRGDSKVQAPELDERVSWYSIHQLRNVRILELSHLLVKD
jgi:hypothetical protein